MKKSLILAVVLASLGLTGCVAYDPYYGPAYVGPSASVVVAPSYYGHYSYYHGGHRYRDWR
jgi:hypothetical protein